VTVILHTVETTFQDVTIHGRMRAAEQLHVGLSWVGIAWEEVPGKGLKPTITVRDPALAKMTEAEAAATPPLHATLKARGVDDPEKVLLETARWMVRELSVRLEAFTNDQEETGAQGSEAEGRSATPLHAVEQAAETGQPAQEDGRPGGGAGGDAQGP
jgi:hypothetical protein